ncbi:hypothetical protein A3J19_01820 [Candidatus Daviesbacteria bacterium RIFCSPLOWO2_02_FULL_41_8]|uniref:Type II secretion system protein GspG C-terminal domain-containing protein n=3 Tax=Candidatus Daviesiibacteriota TaxID=1752718 RepID=A0A1F5NHN7_9BACT|nr:MAG: hypothetical protein A2871_00925 [Candidatus Daviesbacteria bacterium RIFCSPHIGHO2_01_FULL_41_23]OGE32963.1 MAG: hypothetical protein A3D83_04840 [Candidatus Daviesbacteria bacterium RIFCSPHIGHO2_02_FULL_41_10]OGE62457.1 MAG: hypothetical protein A2967_01410 [Candidatus Daviesbacteria bacterium RIFCSPLOWO2_01_FULL_41_32]OGE77197.1 MAG: hypothetical protein A3J19_01820 [Candidatus Daviesbacteria bacterium RIFCSPLOWO2_02_FULL_41_8]
MPKKSSNGGFTLIELLIVIAIIAILSVVGAVIYSGIQGRARDSKREADINAISQAWEANSAKESPRYPILAGSFFSNGIPMDPLNTGIYVYSFTGGAANTTTAGDTYRACATLEVGGTYCRGNQQ